MDGARLLGQGHEGAAGEPVGGDAQDRLGRRHAPADLGPTLPAFLSPNVAKVLIENFGIAGITDVDTDLEIFFGKN